MNYLRIHSETKETEQEKQFRIKEEEKKKKKASLNPNNMKNNQPTKEQ